MSTWVNLTVVLAKSGSNIVAKPYINGRAASKKSFSVSQSVFPSLGRCFVVASGSNKHFYAPKLVTRTSARVKLGACLQTSEWAAQVSRLLTIPQKAVLDVQGSGKCESEDNAVDTHFTEFTFTLQDTNESSGLTRRGAAATAEEATGTPGKKREVVAPEAAAGTPGMMSADMVERLEALIGEGTLAPVGIDVVSFAVVDTALEGTAAAAAATAGLTAGAIVGIAVGGAAGAAAVAGAAVGTGVYLKKRRGQRAEEGKQEAFEPERKMAGKGVDVMNDGVKHSSITGRAPPVAV
eukprot:m51a1_g6803 hypothetical protein (294) ;mRNA; r:243001-243882